MNRLVVNTFYIFIFILMISPRIPIGELSTGKSIDIRGEDIVIAFIFIFSFIHFLTSYCKSYTKLLTYEKLLLLYVVYFTLVTIVSFAYLPINLTRFMYLFKELEFYLLFFIMIQYYKHININTIHKLLFVGIILNLLYILYQIISGNFEGLKNGYYGVATLGEYSSLSSGIMMAFAVIYLFLYQIYKRNIKDIFTSWLSFLGLILTFSRAALVGVVATFPLVLRRMNILYKFILITMGFLALFFIVTYLFSDLKTFARIMSADSYLEALFVRMEHNYMPLITIVTDTNWLIGLGKGMVGQMGLPIEAHNYYLRLFLDSGIIGIFLFLLFILVLYLSIRTKKLFEYVVFKYYLLLILVASIPQDTFIAQKPFAIFIVLLIVISVHKRQEKFLGVINENTNSIRS